MEKAASVAAPADGLPGGPRTLTLSPARSDRQVHQFVSFIEVASFVQGALAGAHHWTINDLHLPVSHFGCYMVTNAWSSPTPSQM